MAGPQDIGLGWRVLTSLQRVAIGYGLAGIIGIALGTIIGIPVGVSILAYLNPIYLRYGVGVLLMIYSIYGLSRPVFAPMKIGTGTDIAIGPAFQLWYRIGVDGHLVLRQ